MMQVQAMLFDLDDTLLDRDQALSGMFTIVLDASYAPFDDPCLKTAMQACFRECDRSGYRDRAEALDDFYQAYPPQNPMSADAMREFWEAHFPSCFSVPLATIGLLRSIRKVMKTGLITNGGARSQRAKLKSSRLCDEFDEILISGEVGVAKPDRAIFEMALKRLGVRGDQALMIGDNLQKDVAGSQSAGIRGIWYNPGHVINDTEIRPFAVIHELERLLDVVDERRNEEDMGIGTL